MEDIKTVLQQSAFRFKKAYGQNFISDEALLDRIVAAAEIDSDSVVAEIGCGAGTLTRAIARAAKRVYAFEIDASLRPVLAQTLRGVDNAEIRFCDFLKLDLPAFEREVGRYTVIANIPYYITTPLVMKLVEESASLERIVVTVQAEVARRFAAEAGTPDYGAITAGIALRGKASIAFCIPRERFYPVPKVDSAVVRIDLSDKRLPVADPALYRAIVQCAFANRRKTLENNLISAFRFSRDEARALLSAIGADEKARGETLSPERLAALSDAIAAKRSGR